MPQIPMAAAGMTCPLHRKDMSKVCHKCPWWTQVRGQDPSTGKEIDTWSCAIAFLPTLLIENSRQSRSGAAATESFRNEFVEANRRSVEAIASMMRDDHVKLISQEQGK